MLVLTVGILIDQRKIIGIHEFTRWSGYWDSYVVPFIGIHTLSRLGGGGGPQRLIISAL
jgi:hypothetical protein